MMDVFIWVLMIGTIDYDLGEPTDFQPAHCLRCEQTFDECRANASEANKWEAKADKIYFCYPAQKGTPA